MSLRTCRRERWHVRLSSDESDSRDQTGIKRGSNAERSDSRLGNLRVLIRLDTADADCADALSIDDDRHATLEHAFEARHAQERRATAVDHLFEKLGFTTPQGRRSRLGWRDMFAMAEAIDEAQGTMRAAERAKAAGAKLS